MILLSVWSASKGNQIDGWCNEANDHSRGNGCAMWSRFYSCTDQGFGCDLCTSVPVYFLSLLAVSVRLLHLAAVGH